MKLKVTYSRIDDTLSDAQIRSILDNKELLIQQMKDQLPDLCEITIEGVQ